MKVLITGITGFFGKHLSEACRKAGHDVYGTARGDLKIHPAKIFYGDLLDENFTKDAVKGMDVVIHCAAITEHDKIVNNEKESTEFNVLSTEHVLEAVKQNSDCLFIFPSSGKVYGKPESLPYTESHETKPSTVLGRIKLEIEKTIEAHAHQDEHNNYVILRIFNVYGTEQKESFLVPTILKQIIKEKKEQIDLGDIKAKRDYLIVDDIVSAFLTIINNKEKLKHLYIFNLGSGDSYSAEEIVNTIAEIMEKKIKINVDKKKLRPDEFNEERADNSKMKNLGWKQEYDLEKGLKKVIAQFQ